MITLISLYLILGSVNSLVIWWCVFNNDYDDFIRDHYQEEPPSTNQKVLTIILGVFIWPVHLYWVIKR